MILKCHRQTHHGGATNRHFSKYDSVSGACGVDVFGFFCLYSETSNANIDMVAREISFPFWKPFNIFSDSLGKVVFNLFNLRLYSPQIMTHFLFHFMSIYGKKCKTVTQRHTHSTYILPYIYNKCTTKHIHTMHTHATHTYNATHTSMHTVHNKHEQTQKIHIYNMHTFICSHVHNICILSYTHTNITHTCI